jgi:hypothetical protein
MINSILSIVGKFIPDQDKKAELAAQLEKEYTKRMEIQAKIIQKESNLGGWAARWRPMTAIIFVGMLVVHYFMYDVAPWIITVFDINVWTPQDPGYTDGLLETIKFCLGGYIFSRTAEKGVKFWRK